MKLKSTALLLFCFISLAADAQQLQLYDNTNYKAIYFKQACDLIANTPNLVLLDVRSPGEYADTSRFVGSRIGRLKGAINISIDLGSGGARATAWGCDLSKKYVDINAEYAT